MSINTRDIDSLKANKVPLENISLTEEEIRNYLLHYEYNAILTVVKELAADYNDKLDNGFPGTIPVTNPSYRQPSINMNISNENVIVGTNINRLITAEYIKNDGGPLISQRLLKNGVEVGTTSYQEDSTIALESIQYTAEVTYEEGPIKQNSLGEDYSFGRIPAGSKSLVRTITGVPEGSGGTPPGPAVPIVTFYWNTFTNLPEMDSLSLGGYTSLKSRNNGDLAITGLDITRKFIVIIVPVSMEVKNWYEVTALNAGRISDNSTIEPPIRKNIGGETYNIYFTTGRTSIFPKLELKKI